MAEKDLAASLLERRTHAMARALLRTREDLVVADVAVEDTGIDLLVSICKNKGRAIEQYGVILEGTIEKASTSAEASQLLNTRMANNQGFEPITLPICVFFFSMVGDRGYYAWLYEPTSTDGAAKLRRHPALECKRLDERALNSIVDPVHRYFSALSKSLVG